LGGVEWLELAAGYALSQTKSRLVLGLHLGEEVEIGPVAGDASG
jgi:hypothetical protein